MDYEQGSYSHQACTVTLAALASAVAFGIIGGRLTPDPDRITAMADTFVLSADPESTAGAEDVLIAGGFDGGAAVSYLKFDLSMPNDRTPERAWLWLAREDSPLPSLVELSEVADTGWEEGGLSARKAPRMGSVVSSVEPGPFDAAIAFDVTKVLRGSGRYGFAVTSPAGKEIAKFIAREGKRIGGLMVGAPTITFEWSGVLPGKSAKWPGVLSSPKWPGAVKSHKWPGAVKSHRPRPTSARPPWYCTYTSRDPETGARNVGIYRMQVYDEHTTGMHWQLHKVGARHGKRYYERGERMPVAVTLGGDPVYTFAATAPLPDGLDELLFAGFLRRKSIELVRCKTIDLEVPADVDFVLEGYVQPGDMRPEGPFGDHTGFYTAVENYPVFHLTAITHRRDAIYPTTIVGKPPMEDFYIGDASVRILLPVFKMNFPEIVDITLPPEGVFHNLVFVSIRKQYPYQAFKVMHGLWGMGQMMFSKYIIAVDEDCDVHNTSEVLFRLCANTDPARDTTVIKNPSDSLDHAPSEQNIGSHMGFDATRKLPGENYHRAWPELLNMTDEARALVDKLQTQTR